MGVVAAADAPLQAFVAEHGQQAPAGQALQQSTAAGSSNPQQAAANSQQEGTPGKLQQAVAAASKLLSELAQAYRQIQASHVEADGHRSSPDLSPGRSQPAKLPSCVVGALATRSYQLSNGNDQIALALLVAAVLPGWGDVRSRGMIHSITSPPWRRVEAAANGHTEAPRSRKRARSISR